MEYHRSSPHLTLNGSFQPPPTDLRRFIFGGSVYISNCTVEHSSSAHYGAQAKAASFQLSIIAADPSQRLALCWAFYYVQVTCWDDEDDPRRFKQILQIRSSTVINCHEIEFAKGRAQLLFRNDNPVHPDLDFPAPLCNR